MANAILTIVWSLHHQVFLDSSMHFSHLHVNPKLLRESCRIYFRPLDCICFTWTSGQLVILWYYQVHPNLCKSTILICQYHGTYPKWFPNCSRSAGKTSPMPVSHRWEPIGNCLATLIRIGDALVEFRLPVDMVDVKYVLWKDMAFSMRIQLRQSNQQYAMETLHL